MQSKKPIAASAALGFFEQWFLGRIAYSVVSVGRIGGAWNADSDVETIIREFLPLMMLISS
jgi:hypothetical protein